MAKADVIVIGNNLFGRFPAPVQGRTIRIPGIALEKLGREFVRLDSFESLQRRIVEGFLGVPKNEEMIQ